MSDGAMKSSSIKGPVVFGCGVTGRDCHAASIMMVSDHVALEVMIDRHVALYLISFWL
jgi:hypothetical protein